MMLLTKLKIWYWFNSKFSIELYLKDVVLVQCPFKLTIRGVSTFCFRQLTGKSKNCHPQYKLTSLAIESQ